MQAREHNPEGEARIVEIASRHSGREALRALSDRERYSITKDWSMMARPKQLRPRIPFHVWLILAGRGFGKTETGAQTVSEWAKTPNTLIACVAPTHRDCRETLAKGQSGIIAAHPKWAQPKYNQGHGIIEWPNGSRAYLYSGKDPDRLRGPNFHKAWIDEAAACDYIDDIWEIAVKAVRLGENPEIAITTTPKPIPFLRERLDEDSTVVTHGTTWENARNLSAKALTYLKKTYAGTDVGREQLEGELLDDVAGARFKQSWFDQYRTLRFPFVDEYAIAIDPSSSDKTSACECGIVGGGIGEGGACYVLHDESMRATPAKWIEKVRDLAQRKKAKRIIYEANYGAGFIEDLFMLLAPELVPLLRPVHADRDKWARAEPVSALAQNGLLRMFGHHPALEAQATTWTPSARKSPDRMDAMVWLAIAEKLKKEPSLHLKNRDTVYG